MEARPTEFRGITYRSKCEAMFALWLELRNPCVIVEYEPDWAELVDYVPDFAVSKPHKSDINGRVGVFETYVEFIEYKPSRPTFTYLADVAKKLREICRRECKGLNPLVLSGGFVYWGSVYSEDRGFYAVGNRDDEFAPIMTNWIGRCEKTIRDFRFDLEVVT